jgi:hypothetical protein
LFPVLFSCNSKIPDYNLNNANGEILLVAETDEKDTLIIFNNGKYYRHTGREDNFIVDQGIWQWGKNNNKIGVSKWSRPWDNKSGSLLTISTYPDCEKEKNINCIYKVLNHTDDYYERRK